MSAKLVHVLVTVALVLTGVGTAVYANVAKLPEKWQQPVMAGIGIAGVAGAGIMAAAVAITEQKNPSSVTTVSHTVVAEDTLPADKDVAQELQ